MANLQDYHNKYIVIRDVKYYITEIDLEEQLQSTITEQEDVITKQKKTIKLLIDKGTTLHGWIQNNATLEVNPGFALDAWHEIVHRAMNEIGEK